jgi:hypothetical protein
VSTERHPSDRRADGVSQVRGASGRTLGLVRFLVVFVIVAFLGLAGADGIAALVVVAVGWIAKGFFEEVGGEIAAGSVRRLRSRKPVGSCPSWVKTSGGGWVPVEPHPRHCCRKSTWPLRTTRMGMRDPAAERSSCG